MPATAISEPERQSNHYKQLREITANLKISRISETHQATISRVIDLDHLEMRILLRMG